MPPMTTLRPQIQNLIDRWKIEVEVDTYGGEEKSFAFYGRLPTGMRILLGMIHEDRRMRHVDEVIDAYLREEDPVLAEALLKDVDTLLGELDEIENYKFGPHDSEGKK